MEQFKSLKLGILVDILSDFTIHYAEMQAKGLKKSDDAEYWQNTIQLLQSEIEYRNSEIKTNKVLHSSN